MPVDIGGEPAEERHGPWRHPAAADAAARDDRVATGYAGNKTRRRHRMTWIERTAYPSLPRAVSLKELRESFTPGDDEMAWARTHTQSDRHLLALVVWLKCYQRLDRTKAFNLLSTDR